MMIIAGAGSGKTRVITYRIARMLQTGFEPEHVLDVLTLMGDSVDNIPGVPGIGPKTAAKLVLQYGSIDNIYAHIDEIKGKRRENLEASRELLEMTRRLVELKDDVE